MKQKPTNHEPYWSLIKRIVKESDLVLEILDARLVELSRNEEVEKIINEIRRPIIFVINKSDLVSKEKLKEQVKKLKEDIDDRGDVVFISAKSPRDTKILLYVIKKVFKKFGKRETEIRKTGDPKLVYREAKADIVVGVLGYPNVGKSSIINALSHRKKMKVSKKAGTTHGIHWIKATNEIKLIDSPGVIPLKDEDEIRYGLIGAKDNERLRNPDLVAHAVIKLFAKAGKKNFEEFYGVSLEGKEAGEIINMIGKKRGFLIKGGLVDENRTCAMIVKDWQEGRLRM